MTVGHKLHSRFNDLVGYGLFTLFFVFSLFLSLGGGNQLVNASGLPSYRYTNTFDTSGAGSPNAHVYSVATDKQGDVYEVGWFEGSINFAGSSGSDIQTAVGGSEDAFITKYNPNGSYGWTKIFDTTNGIAQALGVSTDNNGNVYVTGQFGQTVIFDGMGGSDSQTSNNGSSFLTKINANGSYGWTKIFDTSSGSAFAYGNAVATDASGNIYITGYFQGTVDFDGVGGSDTQTDPSSNNDLFLTKINANGSYGWTKIFDTSASGAQVNGNGVATDGNGNIYVTGYFQNTVDFDGIGGSDTQTAPGNNGDAFLTKINANGSYGWTKIIDNAAAGSFANGYSVTTDNQGNVYTTGYFGGDLIFDGVGGSDNQTDPGSNIDSYITKYNSNGSYGWTKIFDNSSSGSYALGGGVATDSLGDVYLTGNYSGAVTFDGVGGSDTQTSPGGNEDSFLTKYNANGSYGWTKIFDTTSGSTDDNPNGSVATDTLGNVYFAGDFTGTVIFDGVGGSDSQTDVGGNDDGFLTSYAAFVPPTTSNPSSGNMSTKAPNTGFGTYTSNKAMVVYSGSLAFFVILAIASLRRLYK